MQENSNVFRQQFDKYRVQVEAELVARLADLQAPSRLKEAMLYSLQAGGKRLRPVLCLAAHSAAGGGGDPGGAAVALEMIHTYSLIHDDLPAMDNSDLRRGKPTCHRHFDEATAILAGDALLAEAFGLLGQAYADNPLVGLALVRELGQAAGAAELVGGQMDDLLNADQLRTAEELEAINARKTGALMRAAVAMGAIVAGVENDRLAAFRDYGFSLGQAFQVVDDIIDATQPASVTGKTAGQDSANAKTTFVTLEGLEAARLRASRHTREALAALEGEGNGADFLRELAHELEGRCA